MSVAAAIDPKTRPPRWLVIAAAAAVVLVELGALALTLVPRVGPDYAGYYIDGTADCLLQDGLAQVDVSRTVGMTSRFNISPCVAGRGWVVPRPGDAVPDGTLLLGREGTLHFALRPVPAGDLRLSLVALALGRGPLPTVRVLANGRDLGSFHLTRQARLATLTIPHAALRGAPMELTFSLVPATGPMAHRMRLLRWRIDPADAPALSGLEVPGYY